jgi:hypothetical protein
MDAATNLHNQLRMLRKKKSYSKKIRKRGGKEGGTGVERQSERERGSDAC